MILQYRGESWVSTMIRWFTWGKWSHTSWSFCTVQNGVLVGDLSEYESWTKKGVERVPLIGTNHKEGTRIDLYELRKPLTEKECAVGQTFLEAQKGKGYDWAGIFGFLCRDRLETDGKWFCSELVFAFLLKCGRTILQGVKAYQVNPSMVPLSTELVFVGYVYAKRGMRVHRPEPVKPRLCHSVLQPR